MLRPPADDLVHALKYEGWPELGSVMGDAVARIAPETGGPEVVVPTPTTTERLRSRGYNQAELLARRVAEVRGLPLHHALCRTQGRRSQTSLTPTERTENVRGVFEGRGSVRGSIEGVHVFLVDDVLTTGATASEAAAELGRMGAGAVTVLTFARALAAVPGTAR
jgi:ComF family protein